MNFYVTDLNCLVSNFSFILFFRENKNLVKRDLKRGVLKNDNNFFLFFNSLFLYLCHSLSYIIILNEKKMHLSVRTPFSTYFLFSIKFYRIFFL